MPSTGFSLGTGNEIHRISLTLSSIPWYPSNHKSFLFKKTKPNQQKCPQIKPNNTENKQTKKQTSKHSPPKPNRTTAAL